MSSRRILLIDDEEDFCALVKQTLEMIGGYEIVIATNGKDGVKAAKSEKPDLILLDIRMPGMDGFEVLKVLKHDKQTIGIPVVMLSAFYDEENRLKATQGFDEAFIPKPIDIKSLKETIEGVFKRRGIA